MNKLGSRWIVIHETHPRCFVDAIACVRAETEQEAFDEGYQLLGLEITSAIPLEKLEAGWVLGKED